MFDCIVCVIHKNFLLLTSALFSWLRMLENTVLCKIFGVKWDEVTGDRRQLHNEQLYDMYSLQNIIQMVKTIRLRWVEHVARMEDRGVEYKVFGGKV